MMTCIAFWWTTSFDTLGVTNEMPQSQQRCVCHQCDRLSSTQSCWQSTCCLWFLAPSARVFLAMHWSYCLRCGPKLRGHRWDQKANCHEQDGRNRIPIWASWRLAGQKWPRGVDATLKHRLASMFSRIVMSFGGATPEVCGDIPKNKNGDHAGIGCNTHFLGLWN